MGWPLDSPRKLGDWRHIELCVCAGLGWARAAQPALAACFRPANCRASFCGGVYSSAGRTRLNLAAVLAETERFLPCKAILSFRLSVAETKTACAILTRILSV